MTTIRLSAAAYVELYKALISAGVKVIEHESAYWHDDLKWECEEPLFSLQGALRRETEGT